MLQPRCPVGTGITAGRFSNHGLTNCNPVASQLRDADLAARIPKLEATLARTKDPDRRAKLEAEIALAEAEQARRVDNPVEGGVADSPHEETLAPSPAFLETLSDLDLVELDEIASQLAESGGAGLSEVEAEAVYQRRAELRDALDFAMEPIDPTLIKLPEDFRVNIDPETGLPDRVQAKNLRDWFKAREDVFLEQRRVAKNTNLVDHLAANPELRERLEAAGVELDNKVTGIMDRLVGEPINGGTFKRDLIAGLSLVRGANSGLPDEFWEGLANDGLIPLENGYRGDEVWGSGPLLRHQNRIWEGIASYNPDRDDTPFGIVEGPLGIIYETQKLRHAENNQESLQQFLPEGYDIQQAVNNLKVNAHRELYPGPESIGDHTRPGPALLDLEPLLNEDTLSTDRDLEAWFLTPTPAPPILAPGLKMGVQTQALRSATKARISADVAAEANRLDPEAGVDEAYVSSVLTAFAQSAQKATLTQELQAFLSGEDRFESTHGEFTQLDENTEGLDKLEATAQAIYNNTQAHLEAAGITHVNVARGTAWGTARNFVEIDSVYEPVREMLATGKTQTVVEAEWERNPITSWTFDQRIAEEFAEERTVRQSADQVANMSVSAIQTVRVPREAVFSTARTGIGALHESEIVLLDVGGPSSVILRITPIEPPSGRGEWDPAAKLDEIRQDQIDRGGY